MGYTFLCFSILCYLFASSRFSFLPFSFLSPVLYFIQSIILFIQILFQNQSILCFISSSLLSFTFHLVLIRVLLTSGAMTLSLSSLRYSALAYAKRHVVPLSYVPHFHAFRTFSCVSYTFMRFVHFHAFRTLSCVSHNFMRSVHLNTVRTLLSLHYSH